MRNQASRHLSTLTRDIASAHAELDRLRTTLRERHAYLEDCRLRMLIAETPLADLDLHIAAEGCLRIQREVRTAERALAGLHEERGRLMDRLGATV